jgi:hypothetical protein
MKDTYHFKKIFFIALVALALSTGAPNKKKEGMLTNNIAML